MPRQQIILRNDLKEITRLTDFLEAFAEEESIGPKDLFAMTLSLDELVTNVISYGYENSAGQEIRISVERVNSDAIMVLEDQGKPFDPTQAPEPDLSMPVEERRVGGLGIHFVKKMMAEFQYQRVDGWNRVELRRVLNAH